MEVTRRLDRQFNVLKNNTSATITLSEFFTPYQGIKMHQQFHTKEVLSNLVYDLLVESASFGVLYAEFRFNLLRWLDAGLDIAAIISAISKGVELAHKKTGIHGNGILLIRRDFNPKLVEKIIYEMCGIPHKSVVGLDLAGDEKKYPFCSDFRETFLYAKEQGLNITIHAGEFGGPENIWYALEEFGAQRIGHGISAIKDPVLLQHLASKEIMLEISLTSNKWSGLIGNLETHPAKSFLEFGIPVSINTDNPIFLQTNPDREFAIAHQICGLSHEVLQKISLDSIKYSFATQELKEELQTELKIIE